MKTEYRFLRFIVCYFGGVGGATVMLTLLNAIFDIPKYEQSITAFSLSFLPVAAATVLLIRDGLDSFELWARRIINAFFDITCITLVYAAFGILNTPQKMVLGFALGLIGNLALSIPLFIILDRRSKKKLEEINKKLKENSEKEEKEAKKQENFH